MLTRLLPAVAALIAGAAIASSATVYKTVDEQGRVTFSDTPPAKDQPAETLQIPTGEPVSEAVYQQRLEDMRATTDRMASDRREREQHRAEQRLAAQRAARPSPSAPPGPAEPRYDSGIYPGYYPYPLYRYPRYPHNPHHPHHRAMPPYYPVDEPTARGGLHRNSQLMRPILPRN